MTQNIKLHELKIGFVGGGNMAQALIAGLLVAKVPSANIMVSDPNEQTLKRLQDLGVQTTTENEQAVIDADIVILAVKPQVIHQVIAPLASSLVEQIVVSIAAGVSLTSLRATLSNYTKLVRAMPNTPAVVQQGAVGMYADDGLTDFDKAIVKTIMDTAGLAVWVDSEELIHAVTAVAGSAPAYFFYIFEAMIAGGCELGLDRQTAHDLAIQTALGAAQMALDSSESPQALRKKVTSPQGTTEQAIASLQANNVSQHIIEALKACDRRSRELASAQG